MPGSALLAVAYDTGEVKHVAGHPTARISPLVAVLLPPGGNADGIWKQRGVMPAKAQQWAVIVPKIVMVVLAEREHLNARLGLHFATMPSEDLFDR